MRRDGAAIRRERIRLIAKRVLSLLAQSEDGRIPLSKTLAILEYETGLTIGKSMEYLRIGADTEHFTIDEEKDKIEALVND